jgi:hypothetical protein
MCIEKKIKKTITKRREKTKKSQQSRKRAKTASRKSEA